MKKTVFYLAGLLFGSSVIAQTNPTPFNLSTGSYTFTEWAADSAEGTYPNNSIIWTFTTSANGVDVTLADTPTGNYLTSSGSGGAYNATSGVRVNGLGADGIAFINTGQTTKLGEFVVGLNSTGRHNLNLSFTAGTIEANARPHNFIVQYRIGTAGEWTHLATPLIYESSTNNTSQQFTNISLPAALDNQSEIYVKWKYYNPNDPQGSGARAQLRLDDITISSSPIAATPELNVPSTAFTFNQEIGTPSAAQAVAISGANLAENIIINVTAPYEVSLTEGGAFSTSQTLILSENGFTGNVYVRLNATEAGTYNSTLTAQTTGISPDPAVTLNGTAAAPTPAISATGGFNPFVQIVGTPSAAQSIEVSAANIGTNAAVSVTEPFQIALTEDGEYATTHHLTLADGSFTGNVFVRLNGTETTTDATGTFTLSTEGAESVTRSLAGQIITSDLSFPEPFHLAGNTYTFSAWEETAEAGTYPSNMIFWINDAGDGVDPTPETLFIQDWECVYNAPNQSRFLGKGEEGIGFLNTGNTITMANCNGGDANERLVGKPGAAVVGINATNVENINIKWTGRTIAQNNRIYAIRLQYRIGSGEANTGWQDFETVSEYVANENGHSEEFDVTLPTDANNQELIQLRWIYFQHPTNQTTGSRAELALDDIIISGTLLSNTEFSFDSFEVYPNPSSDIVHFSKNISLRLFDVSGKQVLSANDVNQINVSGLAKGVYILKTDHGTSKKIVVK